MKKYCLLVALLMLGSAPLVQAQSYAFTNVTVFPMDSERMLSDQTVIVEDGQITAMGAAHLVQVPGGATRIDGRGKYLVPGLSEMHGHIPPPGADAAFIENVLFLYVANGITTVRGMLGFDNQLVLRDRAQKGELIAPHLYLAGPSFNGNTVNSVEEAEAKVRQQKQEGWDLLKIHPGLTRAEYDAMANTAHEVGITFGGHIPADVGLVHALEKRQITIDHIDGYIEYAEAYEGPIPADKLQEMVEMTKAAGTWIVPTMALWETILGLGELDMFMAYDELKYMPKQSVDGWQQQFHARRNNPQFNMAISETIAENRRVVLKALSDAGVGILMGTDAPQQFSVPGFSLHRELELMADVGMTPYEILKSGSANVGVYFKDWDTFGIIAPGQRADLILTNANPMTDIANLQQQAGVMVGGTWLPQAEINERLEAIEKMYAQN